MMDWFVQQTNPRLKHFWLKFDGQTIIDPLVLPAIPTVDKWSFQSPNGISTRRQRNLSQYLSDVSYFGQAPEDSYLSKWAPVYTDYFRVQPHLVQEGITLSEPLGLTHLESSFIDKWMPVYPQFFKTRKRW